MVEIIIKNCNQCQLNGSRKELMKLYDTFRIKHPNAWHITRFQKGKYQWDGYIKYISSYGEFKIGLLPMVYNTLKSWGVEDIKITDKRIIPNIEPIIPTQLGANYNPIKLYPRQIQAIKTLLNNKVGDTPFLICAGDYSVGFGKTLLFCALYKAYQGNLPTILLLNDSDLFNQFKREIPELLPNEDIAFIQGSKCNRWGKFNVAMVQSISKNIRKYQQNLLDIRMVLIDEADIIDNKTYQTVISYLYNSFIRIGLSGTIYMNERKSGIVHNMNVRQFIGDVVDQVKLSEQIKTGKATKVVVKMIYTSIGEKVPNDYQREYKLNIIENKESYKLSFSRMLYNYKYGRVPMVILCKFIDHCEDLYKYYTERINKMGLPLRVAYLHHNVKNRDKILTDIREGNIDILISTTVIARGKNIPTLQYLQNIASMDSQEKSIQILGRLVRKHESKNKTYLDDFIFDGTFLKRHGNHRKIYYQKQGFKVLKIEYTKKV